MAEWLKPLTFSAVNLRCGFEPSSGPRLGSHVRQAKFCLRMVWCNFLGDLPFSPNITIDSAQNE